MTDETKLTGQSATEIANELVAAEAFPGGIIHDMATIDGVREFKNRIAHAIAAFAASCAAAAVEAQRERDVQIVQERIAELVHQVGQREWLSHLLGAAIRARKSP